jgi:hypothetical protein
MPLRRTLATTTLLVLFSLTGTTSGRAGSRTQATDSVTTPGEAPSVGALVAAGFVNVAVRDSAGRLTVAYENRRWRHSAEAYGRASVALGVPFTAVEERLGLPVAAIRIGTTPPPDRYELDLPGDTRSPMFGTVRVISRTPRTGFQVRYPYETGFTVPRGPLERPVWHSLDLTVEPLFDYELGKIFQPFLYRLQIEPMLRYTPWPGALARAGLAIPWVDQFDPDPLHPDIDRVRPGILSLEQFAWIPSAGLLSLDAGYFGANRYGGAVGLARPVAGGRFLLDAEGSLTGFISFGPGGTEYSNPAHWTGSGALSWRPGLDLSVRVRAARFLYGDQGVELEVRRSFGDLDVAFFAQRIEQDGIGGIRVSLPVPPMTRGSGSVRVQPVERYSLSYRSVATLQGRDLGGVASREDYLRQLNEPAMDANLGRFARVAGGLADSARSPRAKSNPGERLINLTGVTGFVNTPWAGALPDRDLEVGYSHIPAKWAYDNRGLHDNEVLYATMGFLPHLETSLRWTVLPGLKSFSDLVPNSQLTDTDYMASARLSILPPARSRPGLAVGVEDATGTRRFHSSYVVTGLPWRIAVMQGRLSMGYALRVFRAGRYTLDGAFGAFEWAPRPWLITQLEYDTEKWNLGGAVIGPYGFQLRAAFLHMQSASVGVGFGHAL